MNLVDLLILVVVLAAIGIGARSGFAALFFALLGLCGGLVLAVVSAGLFRAQLSELAPQARLLVVVAGVAILLAAGEGLGASLGARLSWRLRRSALAPLDALGGALLGAAHGILIVWLVGSFVLAAGSPRLVAEARRSAALSAINRVLPAPSLIGSSLLGLIERSDLPRLFAGLEPSPAPPVALPGGQQAQALARSAIASTVEVVVAACDREQVGTGFFVAPSVVVTNAHVVSGGTQMVVRRGDGDHPATLTFFDPDHDIALLRVTGTTGPPLTLAAQIPARGTRGVALGHPLAGPLTVIPAAVTAQYDSARGTDIYDRRTVLRSIVELRARVEHGDSGGPLVVAPGVVGGIVFGASASAADVGYALAAPMVAREISRVLGRAAPVGSGTCLP